MSMSPSEDRRFRIVVALVLPVAAVLGAIASADDWSIGWIYVSLCALFALAVVFVHFPPWERSRRRTR
jgi:TRAP-type C4-dicarboxylate transport system permease small subunit